MSRLLILIASLTVLNCMPIWAKDVDCHSDQIPNSGLDSIFKLFGTVKNEILGTVPRFCRLSDTVQLGDEEEGQQELNKLAVKLSKQNPQDVDTVVLSTSDKVSVKANVFNVLKLVILKKMWLQTSDKDQYSLLLAPECTEIGFNRFPIYKSDGPIKSEKTGNFKKAYRKVVSTCKAEALDQLTPFMTKDVLAEAMVHLKYIFPKSFSPLLGSLCETLSASNDLILKNDEYEDFSTNERSISSVEDFSKWMKDNYAAFERERDDGFRLSPKGQSIEMKNQFKNNQLFLKKLYDENIGSLNSLGEVFSKEYPNQVLTKNSQGKYFIKPTKEESLKISDEAKKKIQKTVDSFYEQTQKNLKEIYIEQKNKSPDLPVRYPEFPDFFIIQKDGKYYYEIDPGKKDAFMTKIKNYQEKSKILIAKKMSSPQMQEKLKVEFERQLLFEDLDDPEYKNILSYYIKDTNLPRVVRNSDGSYSYDNSKSELQEMTPLLRTKLNLKHEDLPIPFDYGRSLLGKDLIDPVELFNWSLSLNDFNRGPEEIRSDVLNLFNDSKQEILNRRIFSRFVENVRKTYQSKALDTEKLVTLTDNEFSTLQAYTGSSYIKINNCLRDKNCNDEKLKNDSKEISNLLEKIKNKSNGTYHVLYRGVGKLPDDHLEKLNNEEKDFVVDNAFMSTTANLRIAQNFIDVKGYLYIIKSKSCVGVSKLSNSPSEDEFLCPPGMKFDVKKMLHNSNVYILEEK